MYDWFIFSSTLLGLWLVIYIARPALRREMLRVSLFTMPFGLTEPLFVPRYWTPPALFNLAARTGFDLESFIFCFATGGIASVLYEAVFKVRQRRMRRGEIRRESNALHRIAILSPLVIFFGLDFLTGMNPIYSASIAMLTGGALTMLCRPDLKRNVVVGGLMYTGFYFLFFLFVNFTDPAFINSWNLPAISGILVFGVPAEELLDAFAFGMMWSSVYEHVLHIRLEKS